MQSTASSSTDLSLVTSNRTEGNGTKLHQAKFRLAVRERFFTGRVVSNWKRGPRKVVMTPKLKECLDNAISHMIYSGSPGRSRGLDLMISMGPFQVDIFYDF